MIETDYYILPEDQYEELNNEASKIHVSVDYFLMEFCAVEGETVYL